MIKWGECAEGEALYEAFLPEHEKDVQSWLLRASCRGHLLEERRIELDWPPRFGPDHEDIVALESSLDALIREFAKHEVPAEPGSYAPEPVQEAQLDPIAGAVRQAVLQHYVETEKRLAMTPDQTARLLELPLGFPAAGLYPLAVTGQRHLRMHQTIALAALAEKDPKIQDRLHDLIESVIKGDEAVIESVLPASPAGTPPIAYPWTRSP